jgi:PAS domain-containing protein
LAPGSIEPTLEFIKSVTHPDDIAGINEILENAIKESTEYKFYRRIYQPGGELRYLHEQGKVIRDKNGNAIKLVGIVQDVTEQKNAEKVIEESKHLLQSIFEVIPNGSSAFKAIRNERKEIVDFEFLLVNKQIEKTTKRTDLKGKKLFEVFPEAKSYLMEGMINTVEKGMQFTCSFHYYNKKNNDKHCISYLKFGDGLIEIHENIKESKNVQEELNTGKV